MLYRDYLKDKYQSACRFAIAEGVPCVLESSKGKNIRSYEVYGNSVQDGTPTPDSPVEIQSVGDLMTDETSEHYGKYAVPVSVTGKNIIRYYTTITYPLTVNAYGNTIVINGNSTSNAGINYLDTYKTLLRKGTYTFTYFYDSGTTISNPYGMTIGLRKSDDRWLAYITTYSSNYKNASVSKRFTVSSDTYVSFGLVGNGSYDNLKFRFQLECGEDATDYEPYQEPVTEHIYLDEPLRKIGDYADYIDFKNKKVVRNTKKVTFDGTENWGKETVSGKEYSNFYIASNPIAKASTNVLSNRFASSVSTSISAENNAFISFSTKLNITYATDTVENWKAQLATWNEEGNPFTVWYVALPREESVSLPTLKTIKGTSIISVDTSVQPSNIKAKYIRL